MTLAISAIASLARRIAARRAHARAADRSSCSTASRTRPSAQHLDQRRRRRGAARTRAQLDGIDPTSLPLYGMPFAIKDNIDLAGLADHGRLPGLRLSAGELRARRAARCIDAGAIPLGKTNLDQFATGLVGTRSPYGACRNAFDPQYRPRRLVELRLGGRGGAGARQLLARHRHRRLGPRARGLQQPRRLKPTLRCLSMRGVVPACRSLDCVSIFALTAEDAARVLQA